MPLELIFLVESWASICPQIILGWRWLMIAGNELQGVQALWCKARWWDEQSRAWLEQSTFPSSFPLSQQGPC